MYDAIYPGREWLDTEGKPIQAHGGSVLFWEGAYYWYGENKEKTTGQDDIWHWGVRMYRSTDLCNWEDCGIIIPPNLADPTSTLHPHAFVDRPHIAYNKATGKFVCWLKVMCRGFAVLTADNLTGPYTLQQSDMFPLDMEPGDFDLAVAGDGKAYCYFERVHSETVCADLTRDYTNVTGFYSTHFPRISPPFVREATAHFYRLGKHYLITSGTTGYLPNPSELAVADTWHGPFRVLGNPHPTDESRTSFHSQVSSVFKVQGKKDLYVAVADRWAPDYMHYPYEEYAKVYQKSFDPTYVPDGTENPAYLLDQQLNTSKSRYVWLPIRFDGEMGYIDWLDRWSPDDYE